MRTKCIQFAARLALLGALGVAAACGGPPPAKPADPPKPQQPTHLPKPEPAPPSNLLHGGDFDQTCADWQLGPGQKAVFQVDNQVRFDGSGSLRFDLADAGRFYLIHWIKEPIKPGTTYTFTGYIKTANVTGDVRFTSMMDDTTKNEKTWAESEVFTGDHEWTLVTFDIAVPATAPVGALRVDFTPKEGAAERGTVWVDGLSISEKTVSEEPRNLLSNGGMDAGLENWQGAPPEVTVARDTLIKQVRGGASTRLQLNNSNDFCIVQWLNKDIKPDAEYRLTGYLRTENLNGVVCLTAMTDNSAKPGKAFFQSRKLAQTADWQFLTVDVNTVSDTDTLAVRIDFRNGTEGVKDGTGAIWIDEVSLVEVK